MSAPEKVSARRLCFGPDDTGKALAEWRESAAFLYETVEQTETGAAFHLDCAITQLPRACLIDSYGSGQAMIRPASYVARAPVDQLTLFRLLKGRVAADYEGREATLEPGDLVLLDYQRSQSSQATDFHCLNVIVPRAEAPARFRSGDLHGVRVAGTSPVGKLLGRHLDAIFALVAELSFEEADAAVASVLALAAAIWPEPGAGAVGSADVMLDRALAFIDAHLADPELGPEQLARALGVSRTRLYRIFAATGGISASILKRRLEASVLALVKSAPHPGLVKTIAEGCGFKSVSHFTRAFRDRFGRTPGEVAMLRSSDVGGGLYTDWFDARAKEAGYDTVALWLKAKDA